MSDIWYKLCGPPPALPKQYVRLGPLFFCIDKIEPLIYQHLNNPAGIDLGFATATYQIPNLIPPTNQIYYMFAFGINGRIQVGINYETDSPRLTVGAQTNRRLDRFQAPYTEPFTFQFGILNGNTLSVDVLAEIAPPVFASIWFYGWKLYVTPMSSLPAGVTPIILMDVRSQNQN